MRHTLLPLLVAALLAGAAPAASPFVQTQGRAGPAVIRNGAWLNARSGRGSGRVVAGSGLSDIACPDARTCYAVGYGGAILSTADGGATWRVQGNPEAATGAFSKIYTDAHYLFAVACPRTRLCYAAGQEGEVLSTVDGGATWRSHDHVASGGLYGLACPSALVCYAVGAGGTVVATTDGGATWRRARAGTGAGAAPPDLYEVACPGPRTCYAVGQRGTIVATTDGGATWRAGQVPAGADDVRSVACPSALVCYAVEPYRGAILITTDGGRTWQGRHDPLAERGGPTEVALNGVGCASASTCYAVGSGIVATTDGGRTWRVVPSPGGDMLDAVACPGAGACVAVGAKGAIVTTDDGGRTWQNRPNILTPRESFLNGIACPAARVCYADGASGTILATTDGGATWLLQPSGLDIRLTGIACTGAAACDAVGDGGTILTTVDGGHTWRRQISGTRLDLFAVACPAAPICYATGGTGAILATADGGRTWRRQVSGTREDLSGLACPTATTCYAAGGASILGTTDGGRTWRGQAHPAGGSLSGLACPGVRVCYAVGAPNVGDYHGAEAIPAVVVATTDGGRTWTSQDAPEVAAGDPNAHDAEGQVGSLQAVACPSAAICYAAGGVDSNDTSMQYGAIAGTTNGGRGGWRDRYEDQNILNWTGIACPGPATCYAVGGYPSPQGDVHVGAIVATKGGNAWTVQTTPLDGPS